MPYKYEVKINDKSYYLSKDELEKNGGMGDFAKEYPGATIRMKRDADGKEFDIPVSEYDWATSRNMRPWVAEFKTVVKQPEKTSVASNEGVSQSSDSAEVSSEVYDAPSVDSVSQTAPKPMDERGYVFNESELMGNEETAVEKEPGVSNTNQEAKSDKTSPKWTENNIYKNFVDNIGKSPISNYADEQLGAMRQEINTPEQANIPTDENGNEYYPAGVDVVEMSVHKVGPVLKELATNTRDEVRKAVQKKYQSIMMKGGGQADFSRDIAEETAPSKIIEAALEKVRTDDEYKKMIESEAKRLEISVEDYINGIVVPTLQNELYSLEIEARRPKNAGEYFLRRAVGGSMFGMMNSLAKEPLETRQLNEAAMQSYSPSTGEEIAGTFGSIVMDLPVMALTGGLGSAAGKGVLIPTVERLMGQGVSRSVAMGIATRAAQKNSLGYGVRVASEAVNFGALEGLGSLIGQAYMTGDVDASKVGAAFGKGLATGATMGIFGIGNEALGRTFTNRFGEKVGKVATYGTSLGGRTAVLTGSSVVGQWMEDPNFDINNVDWTNELVHAGLINIGFDVIGVMKRVGKDKNIRPDDLYLTKENIRQLNDAGFKGKSAGEIAENLLRGRLKEPIADRTEKGVMSSEQKGVSQEGDGLYSEVARLMQNESIDLSTKSKIAYLMTGMVYKLSPNTSISDVIDANGEFIVEKYNTAGQTNEQRRFKNKSEAEQYIRTSQSEIKSNQVKALEEMMLNAGKVASATSLFDFIAKENGITRQSLMDIYVRGRKGSDLDARERAIYKTTSQLLANTIDVKNYHYDISEIKTELEKGYGKKEGWMDKVLKKKYNDLNETERRAYDEYIMNMQLRLQGNKAQEAWQRDYSERITEQKLLGSGGVKSSSGADAPITPFPSGSDVTEGTGVGPSLVEGGRAVGRELYAEHDVTKMRRAYLRALYSMNRLRSVAGDDVVTALDRAESDAEFEAIISSLPEEYKRYASDYVAQRLAMDGLDEALDARYSEDAALAESVVSSVFDGGKRMVPIARLDDNSGIVVLNGIESDGFILTADGSVMGVRVPLVDGMPDWKSFDASAVRSYRIKDEDVISTATPNTVTEVLLADKLADEASISTASPISVGAQFPVLLDGELRDVHVVGQNGQDWLVEVMGEKGFEPVRPSELELWKHQAEMLPIEQEYQEIDNKAINNDKGIGEESRVERNEADDAVGVSPVGEGAHEVGVQEGPEVGFVDASSGGRARPSNSGGEDSVSGAVEEVPGNGVKASALSRLAVYPDGHAKAGRPDYESSRVEDVRDYLVESLGEEKALKAVNSTIAGTEGLLAEKADRARRLREEVDNSSFEVDDMLRAQHDVDAADAEVATLQKSVDYWKEVRTALGGKEVDNSELDENGRRFVLSSDGTTIFGEIREESGLSAAPIKLSEGYQDENGKGYGLKHIEANHGEQIRNAGFSSVEEFVSYVAKNYDENNIRVGNRRTATGDTTYLIHVSDAHDNTLYIELSRDGSYWNVNSGGIFRKGYSNKKETVVKTEPQQPNNAVSTDSSLSEDVVRGIATTEPNGEPTVSLSKDNVGLSDMQEKVEETVEQDNKVSDNTLSQKIASAESEVNTTPSEGQKKAGNYKKGHVQIGSFNVTIENPKGSVRSGVDKDGKKWSTTMQNTYGYIRGTEGVDGDHIDVFLSDDIDGWDGRKVFVVDQYNPDGSFDEHKVMLGFNDIDAADAAYLSNYEEGWSDSRKIVIRPSTLEDFEKWINSSHRKTKPFGEYKNVIVSLRKNNKELNLQLEKDSNDGNRNRTSVGGQISEPISQGEHRAQAKEVGELEETATRLRERIAADARASQGGLSESPREVENRITRSYAKEQGTWIPLSKVFDLGTPTAGGNEHDNYLNASEGVIYKVNNRMNTPSIPDLLDRMELHNQTFPETKYSLVGFTSISDKGDVLPVFSQSYIPNARVATTEEIDAYMSDLGFTSEGDGRYSNGQLIIKDLHPRNVLVDKEGDVYVVDAEFEESKTPYLITPSKYTTKKGKELSMHLVTFGKELSKEQYKAAKEIAKSDKGWYDSKKGGFMMRSEASAKDLAERVVSEGAAPIAEAQPSDASKARVVKEQQPSKVEDDKYKPVWEYHVSVDKETGRTTLSRDDVSGIIPIGDGRFKVYADSPEEMLDILRNPLNRMDEILKEVEVTLENKIKIREFEGKNKKAVESLEEAKKTISFEGEKEPLKEIDNERRIEKENSGLRKESGQEVERAERRGDVGGLHGNNVSDTSGGGRVSVGDGEQLTSVARVNNSRNYSFGENHLDLPTGEIGKLKGNIEAIRLLKELEESGRVATDAEKEVLRQFVGWGGLSESLNEDEYSRWQRYQKINTWDGIPGSTPWGKKYGSHYEALRPLLSDEEFKQAQASTLNSHYTPEAVIRGMWSALEQLGFKGGDILEPAMGIAHMIGFMPKEISERSTIFGYELDSIPGRIARQLYPDAFIEVAGYETSFRPNSKDAVVTNVPFGQTAPIDPSLDKTLRKKLGSSYNLHNYFIVKGLLELRPGGVGAFVTSSSTMDGRNSKAREYISSLGVDLVGAIRLPNTAFKSNAGTEVTADLLLFRKRYPGEAGNGISFVSLSEIGKGHYIGKDKHGNDMLMEVPLLVNEYFATHPEMMLGEMMTAHDAGSGGLYGGDSQTLVGRKGADLGVELMTAISHLPENILTSRPTSTTVAPKERTSVKDGVLSVKDGKVYVSDSGVQSEVTSGTFKHDGKVRSYADAAKDYLTLKESLKDLIRAEQTETADPVALRSRVNSLYDEFVSKYGRLNENRALNVILEEDVERFLPQSLEKVETVYDASGRRRKVVSKADGILLRRVSQPMKAPEKADNLQDAIDVSQSYYGRMDINYISKLLSISPAEARERILSERQGYEDPLTGDLIDRDAYLSGNVREKLNVAREAAERDERFSINVSDLEQSLPETIPFVDISYKLGTPWIPEGVYQEFAQEVLGLNGMSIRYVPVADEFMITGGHTSDYTKANEYNTPHRDAIEIFTDAINMRKPTIYRQVDRNTRVKDEAATQEVVAKIVDMNDAFVRYIQEKSDVHSELQRIYNERYNNYRLREYRFPQFTGTDGKIHYPGSNESIALRDHQTKAVQRSLQGSTLLAHQVGTGKTFTMITTAMEMRRLGLAKKPMIVVQNATLQDFASDFMKLYPGANILVPDENERSAKHRKRLFNLIATGDFDAIIVPQSFLAFIPDDPGRKKALIEQRVEEIMQAAEQLDDRRMADRLRREAKALSESISVDESTAPTRKTNVKKQAKKEESALARETRKLDRRTDDVLTFEQMGVDALFIDEAHNFKKIGFTTKMQNVKGIDTGYSERANSLLLKASYVQERNGGRNVILATGTPITNTMAEVWTMMRFVAPEILEDYGIKTFDEFAATFGQVEPSLEQNSTGGFKISDRFKSYVNVPELVKAFRSHADVVLTSDVPEFKEKNSLPRLKDDKMTNHVIHKSDALEDVMNVLVEALKADEQKTGKEKTPGLPLVVFSKAKQAAIDLRLINPSYPDDPNSKTNKVVSEVLRVYKESAEQKGIQMVFCDSYQSPEKEPAIDLFDFDPSVPRFNLYRDIKEKLIAGGIPKDEIVIVNEITSAERKKAVFEKARQGEVRVLIGGTEKMGVGVNVQDRMVALHHMDAPIRPMDFEQRNGRILRQGNMYASLDKPVEILTYGVEGTLDATAYDRLRIKQNFINQMMKGDVSGRVMEDNADDDPSGKTFSQMAAELSGDKTLQLLFVAENKLKKLAGLKRSHEIKKQYAREEIPLTEKTISIRESYLEKMERLAERAAKQFPNGIDRISLNGQTFTDKLSKVLSEGVGMYEEQYKENRGIAPLSVKLNKDGGELLFYHNNGTLMYKLSLGKEDVVSDKEINTFAGIWPSVNSALSGLSRRVDDARKDVSERKKRLTGLRSVVQKSFDKAAELEAARAEVSALRSELEKKAQESATVTVDDSVVKEKLRGGRATEVSEPLANYDEVSLYRMENMINDSRSVAVNAPAALVVKSGRDIVDGMPGLSTVEMAFVMQECQRRDVCAMYVPKTRQILILPGHGTAREMRDAYWHESLHYGVDMVLPKGDYGKLLLSHGAKDVDMLDPELSRWVEEHYTKDVAEEKIIHLLEGIISYLADKNKLSSIKGGLNFGPEHPVLNEVCNRLLKYLTDGKEIGDNSGNDVRDTEENYGENQEWQDESQSSDVFRGTYEGVGIKHSVLGGDLERSHLRRLKEGETSHVERLFKENKNFDFTSGERINSIEDVAYIFKNLEDESVENSFAVLVDKDGRPTVVHLGMGSYAYSLVNGSALQVAVSRIKPKKITFVHNHPSGTLKASSQDRDVLKKLKSTYGANVVTDGIIINLRSGKFGVYNELPYDSEYKDELGKVMNESAIKVYSFNKLAFSKNYDPSTLPLAVSQEAVAEFISSQRLGERDKLGLLVCDQQLRVVGNVFLRESSLTEKNLNQVAQDVVYYTTAMGGTRPILFGNGIKGLSEKLYPLIDDVSLGTIKLTDVVELEMVKEDEASYNGLKKDVRYNRRTIEEGFGGIWIDNKQEFAKFVSAVNNYAFEENGEGIAYTDNYFYAYYVNNENVPIPFARVFLNAEESQSVVTQVNEELQDVGTHERIKEYFNRCIERAWHIQNADNGDDGNNSSLPNRRRVGKLDSNLLRKGKYYDRPSLYVKTQRADTRTGVVHENLDIRYSIRRKPAPKNVEKVYKLMRLGADKELYPLFIDAASPVKLGVWYDADSPNLEILKRMPEGVFLVDYENGTYESLSDYAQRTGEKVGKYPSVRSVNEATNAGLRWVYIEPTSNKQKRYEGESRKYWNLGINGSGTVSTFAMRPGWHAGSLPTMRQIGKGKDKNLRDDSFVWTEGYVSADVNYQSEADKNPDKDIPTHIPVDGYYMKATNANKTASQADRVGWYVAGSFMADRIIGDKEARRIIDVWNEQHPDVPVAYDYDRESGKDFDAESLSLVDKDVLEVRYSLREKPRRKPGESLISYHRRVEEWKTEWEEAKRRREVETMGRNEFDDVPRPEGDEDFSSPSFLARLEGYRAAAAARKSAARDVEMKEADEALYDPSSLRVEATDSDSSDRLSEDELREVRTAFANKMKEVKIPISKEQLASDIKSEIIERRRYIETGNLEDAIFVDELKKMAGKGKQGAQVLRDIPSYIEGTYEGTASDELKACAKAVSDWFDEVYNLLAQEGVLYDAPRLQNYVTHIWDWKRTPKQVQEAYSNWMNTMRLRSPYTRHRIVPSYAEGIKMGMVPKYEDITGIIMEYGHYATEVIANHRMLNFLMNFSVKVPGSKNNMPMDMPVIVGDKTKDASYSRMNHTALDGYKVLNIMKPYITPVFGDQKIIDPSHLSPLANKLVDAFWLASGSMKKMVLSFSFFHHGALTETSIAMDRPWGAMKTIAKDLIWDVLVKGNIPAMNDKAAARDAVNHLVSLGATQDYAAADVRNFTTRLVKFTKDKNIVVAKEAAQLLDFLNSGSDKVLWDVIHDGYKVASFRKMASEVRQQAEREGWSREQLDKTLDECGQLVNDTYGGLHFDILGLSPKTVRILRALLLSPDWTIATIRQALSPFGVGALYQQDSFWKRMRDNGLGMTLKETTPGGIRKKYGRQFWLTAMIFFYGLMNGLNAYFRIKDEDDDKAEADKMRELNPDYRSAYELAYPDGMKWYDYTMAGNALGHQTHLFTGHYSDGTESYVRWGKQFRELPELFFGRDGLSFPGPMIDKISGKVNPFLSTIFTLISGHSLNGFENKDMKNKKGWERDVARLYVLAKAWLPYSVPTQEDKDFMAIDLMMPSSKGMSPYKAIDYFKKAIMSGDSTFVGDVYRSVVLNGLDADKYFDLASRSLEAEAKKNMIEGIETVDDAVKMFDSDDNLQQRKRLLRYVEQQLGAQDFVQVERDEIVNRALDILSGSDEDVKASDAYMRVMTGNDLLEDYRMKKAISGLKRYYDDYKSLNGEDKDAAQRMYSEKKRYIDGYMIATRYRSAISRLKKGLGKGDDEAVMRKIRELRKELFEKL